jgi:hypothetical protein
MSIWTQLQQEREIAEDMKEWHMKNYKDNDKQYTHSLAKGRLEYPSRRRALSAYTLFCKDSRPQIRQLYPNIRFGELNRLLHAIWKKLGESKEQSDIDFILGYERESLNTLCNA